MTTLHIDGREYEAHEKDNLLHACLSLGLDVPYFCWHPALGSVGACRQCAVKQFRDEKDSQGRLVMACMTPAADGARVSIQDPEAKAFRASVIEWLMTNHPHDCPVCEEGGECHLQDMTVLTGHAYRRYRFGKRTHRNQYLGPFVKHEMNRCIACYRCVRFYRDYAGGRDLDVFGAHNHVYFGRESDGVLESDFSGNLVEVCPTGVFTDRTLSARYTRKWDLQSAPSVCVHCGLGCNTLANARYGEVRRILNRYHGELNGYFLCDRGRYGYDFVNGPARIRTPLEAPRVNKGPTAAQPLARQAALARAVAILREGDAIGVGSPRASLESNFALRELVGRERFHLGISDRDDRLLAAILESLRNGPAPAATLREAEESDAVLILGEDVPATAPRLALALRQMVRRAGFARAEHLKVPLWQDAAVRDVGRDIKSPLLIATPAATRLDELATLTVRAAPDDIARLGFAVAHALCGAAAAAADLDEAARERASRIAEQLSGAHRAVIVAGTSLGSEALIRTAASIARALRGRGCDARLLFIVPECNSIGTALLGGEPLAAALDALREGRARTLVVLENDLYRRAERGAVNAALEAARHVIAIDHTLNETVHHAELVFPAATFAESSGTLVSSEGRAQRFFQVLSPRGEVSAGWRWLNELARAAAIEPVRTGTASATLKRWRSLDEAIAALGRACPQLAAIGDAAPSAAFRVSGERVASAPARESGRTSEHADRSVFEPPPPPQPDAPYTGSMEGYYGVMPGALYPFYWAPSWNSVQSLNKFQQEVGGPLRGGNPGVRLIEPPDGTRSASEARDGCGEDSHDRDIPHPFEPREGLWLVVPQYHVFGSEELSALAPAIAERIAGPTLALHPEDAAVLGVRSQEPLELVLDGATHRALAQLHPELPRGVAALSAGLPGLPAFELPAWLPLRRVASAEPPR